MVEWTFMTANYVARELDYNGEDLSDWGRCHDATVKAFHGPQFAEKFEELVVQVKACGFDSLELWVAHLDPFQATPEMIQQAVKILEKHNMKVHSYTAGFGTPGVSRDEAVRIFETARAIGARVLAQGFHPANGPIVQELAQTYGIRMGLENHPEKTPQEAIDKIRDFAPWVGVAIDTGWFATQGYDPVQAVRELKDYIVHVHLKDIRAAGSHETCALGDGVVDVREVLAALKEIGYNGVITIEHEPMDYDPTDDVIKSLERAKRWWAELNG